MAGIRSRPAAGSTIGSKHSWNMQDMSKGQSPTIALNFFNNLMNNSKGFPNRYALIWAFSWRVR